MAFREVDDNLWEKIKPILPAEKPKKKRQCNVFYRTFKFAVYQLATTLIVFDEPLLVGRDTVLVLDTNEQIFIE